MSTNVGTHSWLVLMKAHRALAGHAQRSIDRYALGMSEFVVLEMLLHKGDQKVNDIGRRIGLTSGAITSAVDRLENQGLVTRCLDAEDRRARLVRLTPKGLAHIREAFAAHSAAMDRAARGLTKAEHATLAQLLKKLGQEAERQLSEEEETP